MDLLLGDLGLGRDPEANGIRLDGEELPAEIEESDTEGSDGESEDCEGKGESASTHPRLSRKILRTYRVC